MNILSESPMAPATNKGISNDWFISDPFPLKLYDILTEFEGGIHGYDVNGCPPASSIISWQPCGTCFRVHDPKLFAKLYMSHFFRQTRWKSFLRQLGLYNFKRIWSGPNKGAYEHPFFVRGNRELCKSIFRKKAMPPAVGKSPSRRQIVETPKCKSTPPSFAPPQADSPSALPIFGQKIQAGKRLVCSGQEESPAIDCMVKLVNIEPKQDSNSFTATAMSETERRTAVFSSVASQLIQEGHLNSNADTMASLATMLASYRAGIPLANLEQSSVSNNSDNNQDLHRGVDDDNLNFCCDDHSLFDKDVEEVTGIFRDDQSMDYLSQFNWEEEEEESSPIQISSV